MRVATLMLCVLSLLPWLSGCAASRSARLNDQELHGRVLHLENLAAQRDQELSQLRDELDAERQARFAMERRAGGAASTASSASTRAGTASVRDVQRALQRAGFDPGPADGKMGRRTRTALRSFQQAQGLIADGRIGPLTLAKLRPYMTPATSGEK